MIDAPPAGKNRPASRFPRHRFQLNPGGKKNGGVNKKSKARQSSSASAGSSEVAHILYTYRQNLEGVSRDNLRPRGFTGTHPSGTGARAGMFRRIFKRIVGNPIENKINEAEYIFQHVARIFLEEQTVTLQLYGEAMYKIVNDKSISLKLSPSQAIFREKISWRHLSSIEEDLEDVSLLELGLVSYNFTKADISEKIIATCKMILTVHYDLIINMQLYSDVLSSEMPNCSILCRRLVSELYLIGSGENSPQEFRDWLFSSL